MRLCMGSFKSWCFIRIYMFTILYYTALFVKTIRFFVLQKTFHMTKTFSDNPDISTTKEYAHLEGTCICPLSF